uniref:Uncharacterized protein n=1 Tax=Magallana gigas TaxID=29159 RepID=A0A8W8LKD5_MAGGI
MEFLEVPVQKTRNVRFVDLDTDFPPQFSFQKPGGSDASYTGSSSDEDEVNPRDKNQLTDNVRFPWVSKETGKTFAESSLTK